MNAPNARIILSPRSYARLMASAPPAPSAQEASAEYWLIKSARAGQLFRLTESGREEPISPDDLFEAWKPASRPKAQRTQPM
jgi:hypothetical protein